MPAAFKPCLATLVEKAPAGGDWLHEVKFDGYRILAAVEGKRAKLISRNGLDWTARFYFITEELARLKVKTALLDGEVVAVNAKGVSDFGALQEALSSSSTAGLVYYVFDLLHLDGYDLRDRALEERKRVLEARLKGAPSRIYFSEHHVGGGPSFFESACKMALEGIVSKRRSSTYEKGRARSWLKVKCTHREEFVIVGFTDPAGSRIGFGSLILGYYDRVGTLYPAGKVGTGFDTKMLANLRRQLDALPQVPGPFKTLPITIVARTAHWVEPRTQVIADARQKQHRGAQSIVHVSQHPVVEGGVKSYDQIIDSFQVGQMRTE